MRCDAMRSDHGVFNFEGGCYAKTYQLKAAAEPEIFRATHLFGTILENVVVPPLLAWKFGGCDTWCGIVILCIV